MVLHIIPFNIRDFDFKCVMHSSNNGDFIGNRFVFYACSSHTAKSYNCYPIIIWKASFTFSWWYNASINYLGLENMVSWLQEDLNLFKHP